MTFLELQNQTLRACGHPTAAVSEPRTRVKAELNAWQRRILTRPGYSRLLRDSETTFYTVPNQATYGLGIAMGRLLGVQAVVDRTVLALRDTAFLRRAGTTQTLGSASCYIPRGWFPVYKHPAGATVTASSTNAADTTQIIDWDVSTTPVSGHGAIQRHTGTTTLNGIVPVNIGGGLLGITEIVRLTLRTPAAGTVSFGGSAEYLELQPGQTSARYLHVTLFPTPASAVEYRIDYTREIADMVQDTDVPLLPPDYHHLLALGAEYDEWRKLSDDRMVVAKQDLEMEIRSLNAWLWDLPDDSQLGRVGVSRLGGNYPADRWI